MVMFMKECGWRQEMVGWGLGILMTKKPSHINRRLKVKIFPIDIWMLLSGDGEKD